MLELTRSAIRLRRDGAWSGGEQLRWRPSPAGSLAFVRGEQLLCLVNVDAEPLPVDGHLLLASGPLTDDGRLPADTAAWLRPPPG